MEPSHYMDWKWVVDVGFGFVMFIGGWILNKIWSELDLLRVKHDNLQKELFTLSKEIPKNYVGKGDFDRMKDEIYKRFDKLDLVLEKISEKLALKKDKDDK